MGKYDQKKCEQIISEMLTQKSFLVSRESSDLPKSSLQAIKGDKKIRILVKHLEFDGAYNNSTLPYQVYKIEAFDNEDERRRGNEILQFVLGYNFKDGSFACVPISEFSNVRSVVVHQREGLRANYYNSWNALDEYMRDRRN